MSWRASSAPKSNPAGPAPTIATFVRLRTKRKLRFTLHGAKSREWAQVQQVDPADGNHQESKYTLRFPRKTVRAAYPALRENLITPEKVTTHPSTR
jgi:hypothetical protein